MVHTTVIHIGTATIVSPLFRVCFECQFTQLGHVRGADVSCSAGGCELNDATAAEDCICEQRVRVVAK